MDKPVLNSFIEVEILSEPDSFGSREFQVVTLHDPLFSWRFREPVFSEWMQCDAGTFQEIVDYIFEFHEISFHASEINDFLKSEMLGA